MTCLSLSTVLYTVYNYTVYAKKDLQEWNCDTVQTIVPIVIGMEFIEIIIFFNRK